jgi:hypothetical protein
MRRDDSACGSATTMAASRPGVSAKATTPSASREIMFQSASARRAEASRAASPEDSRWTERGNRPRG